MADSREVKTVGGVENTRLEAKDTKKKPEAKDRNALSQGPRTQAQVFSEKKVFKKLFLVISKKLGLQNNFSGDLQNFNNSKYSAVLKPRAGQFSRTWGFKDLTFEAKDKTSKWDFKVKDLTSKCVLEAKDALKDPTSVRTTSTSI